MCPLNGLLPDDTSLLPDQMLTRCLCRQCSVQEYISMDFNVIDLNYKNYAWNDLIRMATTCLMGQSVYLHVNLLDITFSHQTILQPLRNSSFSWVPSTVSGTMIFAIGYIDQDTEARITLQWRHMDAMVSAITVNSIMWSTACSDQKRRKHQSSVLLTLREGKPPVSSEYFHKRPSIVKPFPCMTL